MYGLNKIILIHTLVLQADIKKMYASAKVEENNKTELKKEIKKRKLPQPP